MLGACLRITDELLKRPLNTFFKEPVDKEMDNLPGYAEKVSRPMDLSTVRSNLQKGVYRTAREWYADMCLIYENAITYHTEESPWGIIAAELLRDFKKTAAGFNAESFDEWSSILAQRTRKLKEKLDECPVRQGRDDLVRGCVERGKLAGRFQQDAVPDLVERLQELLEKDDVRAGMITVLKMSQKNEDPLVMEDGEFVIDVAKLKDQTLHALNMYARAVK